MVRLLALAAVLVVSVASSPPAEGQGRVFRRPCLLRVVFSRMRARRQPVVVSTLRPITVKPIPVSRTVRQPSRCRIVNGQKVCN